MSHSSETTGGLNKTQNLQVGGKKKKKITVQPICLCYNLVSYKIKVLQLEMEVCSRYTVAVRGLRCEFKGFLGDAAWPHCCDRRAFLLAFIFSRRFTRWLLVISISSILSRAVRSCMKTQQKYLNPVIS